MTVQDLIDELESAKRRTGPHTPIGIRSIKYGSSAEGREGGYPIRVTTPVIIRFENGNLYLDPES